MKQRVLWDEDSKGVNSSIDSTNPLKATVSTTGNNAVKTNIGFTTGKLYMEFTLVNGNYGCIGVCNENFTNTINESSVDQITLYYSYSMVYPSGASIDLPQGTTGDIVNVKLDLDNKYIYFGINNSWDETGYSITGTTFYPILMNCSTRYSAIIEANFGETDFVYDIPEGYISPDMLFRPILLKVDDDYYSIKDDYYDTTNQQYNILPSNFKDNIEDYEFLPTELLTEITIDGETFKPIDKFDQFQLISAEQVTYNIIGLKSNKELIISNQNLSTISAETIYNFLLDITKVTNGDCKFVISADNGQTWNTWNGTTWDSLTNTCLLDDNGQVKQYSKLSDSEKVQWNKLRDEIWTNGMSTDITDVDYSAILTNNTIRFAFILYRPSYEDNITLTNTQWLFDKIGSWHKLSEDDIDIAINSNSCIVTPKLQNLENVKVNILI